MFTRQKPASMSRTAHLNSMSIPLKCPQFYPDCELICTNHEVIRYVRQWLCSPCGPWPLHTPHRVGTTPWMGDQPISRSLPTRRTIRTQNKRTQTSMAFAGIEPTIPVFERAKTVHASDRAATVIRSSLCSILFIQRSFYFLDFMSGTRVPLLFQRQMIVLSSLK
jgi:hypothetical protein